MFTYLQDAIAACDQALRTDANLFQACQTLGNTLQMLGRFSLAVQWHTWSIQPPQQRTEMFASLGNLYAQENRWQEAIDAYEHCLTLDPKFAPACWSLANLYAELGRPEAEIVYRQRAMQLNPKWATPGHQWKLGNRLLHQQRADEAIACYQEAVEKAPDFFAAHYNLALSLIQQEQWQEAIAALEQTLALEPQYAPAYYALGQIAQQQEDWTQAQAHYRTAISLDSEYLYAFCALGETSLKLHEWEEAVTAYRAAIELGADFPWSYHNLGYGLLKQQHPEAETWLRRAIACSPESSWFYIHLSELLVQQNRWQEAMQALLTVAQLQPDWVDLYQPLGRTLRKVLKAAPSGVIQDAILTDALKPTNRQVAFYAQMAQRLAVHQQYEGALWFYRLALQLQPGNRHLQNQLQQTQASHQHFNQTIGQSYWGIKQSPDQVERYTQLAHVLADQGEAQTAITLHRHALKLHGWQQAADRKYRFTRDWFTHNLPSWRQHLQEMMHQPNLQALEVGCFEGMASCWLLDHVLTDATAHLTVIDRYLQDHFVTNIQRANAASKVTRHMGDSHRVLSTLSPHYYDLIYISGCPFAQHIQRDGELAWALLKPGGIIIFDYYGWVHQNPPEQASRIGIDAFLAGVQAEVNELHRDYQVIARKGNGLDVCS